jgi:hypothetical protein
LGKQHKVALRLRSRHSPLICNTKRFGIGRLPEFHALGNHLNKPPFQTVNLGNFLISLFVINSRLGQTHQFQADMRCHFVQSCVFSNKQLLVGIITRLVK